MVLHETLMFFFSIKDQKQGKSIMTRTSATEDTNRKKRNEMKRGKKQRIQTTVSKGWWYPPAITHEVRLLDSKLKAPRCNRVHTNDYTCFVTYMHWYREMLQIHISSISLKMVLANRINMTEVRKAATQQSVALCVRIQTQCFFHLKYLSSCHKRSTIRD